MRRLSFLALCTVMFQLLLPAPAHAWFGWIDDWSGPGPFITFDLQYRVACIPDTKEVVETNGFPNPEFLQPLSHFKGERRWWAEVSGAGCIFQPSVRPRASGNFRVGTLVSQKGEKWGKVVAYRFEPSFSAFLDPLKIFELTGGIGTLLVTGDTPEGKPFDSLWRTYSKAMVTIAPFAMLQRNGGSKSYLRTITISPGVQVIPQGFDAKDFGATNAYHTNKEVQFFVEVVFLDFSRF